MSGSISKDSQWRNRGRSAAAIHCRRLLAWVILVMCGSFISIAGCRRSDVVAEVNGRKITSEQFKHVLESRHGLGTLRRLIDRRLLSDVNRRMKLVPEWRVKRELERRKQAMGGAVAFRQWLRRNNLTERLVRDEIRAELVLQMLQALKRAQIKPTEKQLRNYFEQNKDWFLGTDWVTLRVIEARSRNEAEMAYAELEAGKPFIEVASRYNFRAEVRNKRGLLGTLPLYPEMLNEQLVQVVEKLSVGQYSKPIRLDSIWTIVWVEKRIPANKVTYKAIKSYVQLMFVNAQTPSLTDVMDELRRSARVQVHAKEYKAIESLYGKAQQRRTTPQATQRRQGK